VKLEQARAKTRKTTVKEVSWRYSPRLLYLECVCVTGSPLVTSSPKKAGATDVDVEI
jgi:hypothetical protein